MSDEFKESEAAVADCENCSAIFDPALGYCPHCGSMQADSGEMCGEHPRREALARCVACETPVCDECAREHDGRYTCENDVGAAETEPWTVIFSSAEEWEVEARRQLLNQSHISAVRFAPGDYRGVHANEHELRIPPSRDEEAKEVLESAEISLVNGGTHWEEDEEGEQSENKDELQ